MTPGEPSGRGYGHDDRYRPPRSAYPPDRGYRTAGPGTGNGFPPAGHYQAAGHYQPDDQWTVVPSPDPRAPTSAHQPWDRPGGYQPAGRGVARHRLPRGSRANGVRRPRMPERDAGSTRRQRRKLPLWQELPLLLVIAFCLAVLIRSFLLQAFYIPSGSMEDTLIAGDRVLVNKLIYDFRDPSRGEVVVFQGPPAWAPQFAADGDPGMFSRVGRTFGNLVGVSQPGEKDFIKRVVGVPGDVVSCCDEGRVVVNGVPLEEPYVIRDSPLIEAGAGRDCRNREFEELVVPPGELFVLGDHRQRSQDSRCQGMIPLDNVIGRAFLIVWPNDRWAGLSATDAFAGVPAPVAAGAPAAGPGATGQVGLVLPLLLPLAARRARTAPVPRSSGRRLSA